MKKVNYNIVKIEGMNYIDYTLEITNIRDIMDMIATTMETDIFKVIVNGEKISEDFYNLRTGFAGEALQKFINYNVKVGIILENQEGLNLRFREMIGEANKSNEFRMFKTVSEAETWFKSL